MGARVIGTPVGDVISTLLLPPPDGETVAPAKGAAVGKGVLSGTGTGGAELVKLQSMSPPISYSSGTQQGQSTKGT